MASKTIWAAAGAAAGLLGYAVRGRSAALLAPSVYRGSSREPKLALTFDDGPSEATPDILNLLDEYGVKATFFQIGANVRRLPEFAREVAGRGHEIGNHSDTHPLFVFRNPQFIHGELARAQETISEVTGQQPGFLRVPYGARWFGLREAQRRLSLLGVMWTVIGCDWKLPARRIADRILRGADNGGILCLHDGRELERAPEAGETVESLRQILPPLLARGFQFVTIGSLVCPTI